MKNLGYVLVFLLVFQSCDNELFKAAPITIEKIIAKSANLTVGDTYRISGDADSISGLPAWGDSNTGVWAANVDTTKTLTWTFSPPRDWSFSKAGIKLTTTGWAKKFELKDGKVIWQTTGNDGTFTPANSGAIPDGATYTLILEDGEEPKVTK